MSKAPAKAPKATAAPAADGAAKGGGKKKLILIGLIAVCLIAGGAGAYFAFMTGGEETAAATEGEAPAEAGHGEAPAEGGHGAAPAAGGHGGSETAAPGPEALYEMADMTLNIRGFNAAGAPVERLIRVSMTIAYDTAALARHGEAQGDTAKSGEGEGEGPVAGIDAMVPHLRDVFLDYLRQITTRDLDGSLGFATVKAELLKRAKAVMGNDIPREILIRDLVVQ